MVDQSPEAVVEAWRRESTHAAEPSYTVVLPLGIPLEELASALRATEAAALQRSPHDPTAAASPDPTPDGWVLQITEGSFTDAELTSWLADLKAALAARGLPSAVQAYVPPRVPTTERWEDLGPAWSGFLYFEQEDPESWDTAIKVDRVDLIARATARWVGSDPRPGVVLRTSGGSDFISTRSQVEPQLRELLPLEPSQVVQHVVPDGRAFALLAITYEAFATVQVVDEAATDQQRFDRVVDSFRELSGALEYAFCRLGRINHAGPTDVDFTFGRPATWAEDASQPTAARHLWRDHVVGAFPAQVLSRSHFERLGIDPGDGLRPYVTEPLDDDRFLVSIGSLDSWTEDNQAIAAHSLDPIQARPPEPG